MPEDNDVLIPELVATSALEAQDRAAIDVQIATAKKYPRSIKLARQSMLEMATMDQETAESCFYGLKRKDKNGKEVIISGPSVRLAEIVAVSWGNMRAGARIIDNDGRFLTAQGVCFDVQNNLAVTMETKRRITTSGGKTFGDDMQVVTGNAAAAIAFRNAVFKVVPKSVWGPIYEETRKTAVGTEKTLPQRRERAVQWFVKEGVDLKKILNYLGIAKVEEIMLEQLERLTELRTAIKDGDTTFEEAFAPPAAEPEKGTLKVDDLKPAADQKVRSQSDAAAESAQKETTAPPAEQKTAPTTAEAPKSAEPEAKEKPQAQAASAPAAPAEQPAPKPKPLVFGQRKEGK